jgi:uncharacterized DUF497 family protein
MSPLVFAWDTNKAKANERKHGISFEEARTAFLDRNARSWFDPDHSAREDRHILLGMSAKLRLLIVSYCYRESTTVVRVASARKANKREQGSYWRP